MKAITRIQEEKNKKFLESIPSFPLDVSVAAYYLKATNVSYQKYLENLEKSDGEFLNVQENILKDSGSYIKTRYSILTLSLQNLLNIDKDFKDLLLFISLLDSQNIPRELLEKYKGEARVDNFIYSLKKYSLIRDESPLSVAHKSNFSLHRSTQDIIFSYLTKSLKLNTDSQLLKRIVDLFDDDLDDIVEQENISKMREIIPHVEKFLQHQNLLSEFSKGLLKSKLGSIYYFTNMANSQLMLADSLKTLEKENFGNLSAEDRSKVARSFLHIGAIYTELRLEKEAQEIIEKAIGIYQRESERNNIELSWALSHIGNVHRRLGNYEKARNSLEESVRLHKLYGVDNKRLARTLAYLGSTYRGLGFYQKSIDSLKESLALYNHTYSKDHFRIGWTLTQLGNVYRRVGDPQKAKTCFEESVLIFENYLPQDHINMAVSLAYLGNCYGELGDHEKARKYLEESLKIHQKHFDENHRRMGWILFHLASAYKATGQYGKAQKLFDRVLKIYANHYQEENIETAHLLRDVAGIFLEKNSFDNAESYIKRSLKILQARNHVDAYRSLEVLGDIYLKKSIHPSYQKNEQGREDLKNLAIDKFSQALKIIEQHFPKNSIYMKKINFKIKKAQE